MVQQKYTIEDAIELSYSETILPFWKPYGQGMGPHVFCQWYKCRFSDKDYIYNCTEQYMMAKKAELFGDKEMHDKIMLEQKPDIIRKLGRLIKNFDSDVWNAHKFDIVYTGNLLKFSQNEGLKNYLKSTDNSVIVEASPYDNIWGVKLSADNDDINYPEKWKGENLLGFAIMQVRDELRK